MGDSCVDVSQAGCSALRPGDKGWVIRVLTCPNAHCSALRPGDKGWAIRVLTCPLLTAVL